MRPTAAAAVLVAGGDGVISGGSSAYRVAWLRESWVFGIVALKSPT